MDGAEGDDMDLDKRIMNGEVLQRFCKNVNAVLKKQGKRIGELEDEVGLSRGYLSRVSKANELTRNNLSAYNLLQIAEYLGVSLDYLLRYSDDSSTEEKMICDFLEEVTRLTETDEVSWNVSSAEDNERMEDKRELCGPIVSMIQLRTPEDEEIYPPHIMKQLEEASTDTRLNDPVPWFGELSLGKGKEYGGVLYTRVKMNEPFYYAELKTIESTMYLYEVAYVNKDETKEVKDVVECYLQSGKGAHFIASSQDGNEYITTLVRGLICLARDKSAVRRLDDDTRNLLNQFISLKKEEEE